VRRRHLAALRPLCPVCRGAGRRSELELATVVREEGETVIEGVLRCPGGDCLREYPVLDGVPLIVAGIRDYVGSNLTSIYARGDLSETLESIVGDCCGPGSPFDATRQRLSSYGWDHYGDLDPAEPVPGPGPEGVRPGSLVRLLERGLALAGDLPAGPVIDVGCAVGRSTFELARRCQGPVLGIDLDFAMLRAASRVLRRGEVRYPRRRVGVVYDRRSFAVELPGAERVDFWACDAQVLPFASGTFAAAASLNLIDCVASPADAVASLAGVLAPGGKALVATPYDWSPGATPVEAWLGGHSQRGEEGGAGEPALRRLLGPGGADSPGLRTVAEEPALPWRVRLHDRSAVDYRVHLVAVEKEAEKETEEGDE